MKKNTLKFFALVLLACFAMVGFAGCFGNEPVDPTEPSETPTNPPVEQYIELNQSQITLDKGNDCTLLANVVGVSDPVVWESSDEAVATVENGKVIALAAGEAEITATAGNFSAKCTVTVVDNGVVPGMAEYDADIEMLKNGTFDVSPVIVFAGAEKDNADAQLTYTVADPSIVSIDANGVATALKVGTTTFTVSGSFRGVEMLPVTGTIVVKTNIVVTMNSLNVNLYASNPDGSYETQFQLAGAVYVDSQLKEDAVLVWETEDKNMATVDNGLVTAKRAGSVKITATYTDDDGEIVKTSITVNISRPVIKLDGMYEFDLSNKNGTSTMDLGDLASLVDGKFTGFYDITDGARQEIADASYEGALSLPNNNFAKHGYRRYALESDTVSIEFDALTITKKIYTFEDLESIAVTGDKLDGYYTLEDDIYCEGRHVHLVGIWTNSPTTGFIGTFDGKGHIIDSFDGLTNRGLFYCTGAGVIKNVAFTNTIGDVVLANGEIHGTTFENIFVSGSARYFTAATWDSPIYKNIIFMSTGSDPRMFDQGGTGNLTMTNVFTVGTAVRGYWNSTTTETNAKFFADANALVAALAAEGELDKWVGSPFSVVNGKLLFGDKVMYQPVATLTGPTMIIHGSSETYTSNGIITLKNAIDGVSIVDGVLTVDASVPVDTVITLVATLNNDPDTAVELEVLVSVVYEQIDLTSKGSIGDLETSEATSYITLPSEITGDVTGVSFSGVHVAISATDGKLAVPQEAVTAIYNACGYTEQSIQIYTADDKCYTVTVSIVTKAIGTFEELESIAVTGNKLDGYFVLTDDIYCEGKHVHLVGAWTNTTTTGFVGTFDGRGHIIDGFNGESNRGLFYCTGAGVIKNVAFTNATGTVVLANGEIHGTTFENIFVSGSARCFTAATWDSPVYKNVIFMSTGTDPRMFDQGGAGNLTMTNVFTVGTTVHGYWNAATTETNANFFADANALVAALGAEGELDKWTGSGFSVEDGKLLFFGRVVIE